MEANVTLHWFVHPQWFDDLGGWLEAKNIRLFVDWAELAFKHFGEHLELPRCNAASSIAQQP